MTSSGVSGGGALSAAQFSAEWDVKIARKALDHLEQQGQNALQLIDSAASAGQPPANVAVGVGQRLNIVG